MQVRRLTVTNFRGISSGTVEFAGHTLLVGGNNVGKSTVCEALDLVLGPERLFRHPVVDEHDFHRGAYLDDSGRPLEVRISATLVDLSPEARRRFHRHLRPWDEAGGRFRDETTEGIDGDAATTWALPLVFLGRYDAKEDDFVGQTFFEHPVEAPEESNADEPDDALGKGLQTFGREQKRFCGFVFLRALRTGSRALSLQRGSLLDTILRLGGDGISELWLDTLRRLRDLEPAIGEIEQLRKMREELHSRMARFVNLGGDETNATAFFASDLTRDHLREVVSLFISAQPGNHLLPFDRLGTGSINLLVFALLTFIAELKDKQSVIFAMEEPEIALPPHTQRRVMRFVLGEMGQSVVTSHSPYVIEQFEPSQIVVLDRDQKGMLVGRPANLTGIKPKALRTERRQFAEAILGRGVLVVEGASEAAIFPAAASVLERSLGPDQYSHLDMDGVCLFDAGGSGTLPRYGPAFVGLGKKTFAFYDKLAAPFQGEAATQLSGYNRTWESPDKGIEVLLAKETAVAALRRFMADAALRPDYPKHVGFLDPGANDGVARTLAQTVLAERKGDGHAYGALLLSHCADATELPATIKGVLLEIHGLMSETAPHGVVATSP